MVHSTRIRRARGCLLGLAVGDALGAPLEGLSAPQIRTHYGLITGYVDGAVAWRRKPYRWRMPGLYTDDTQQALALADVLVERGFADPDRLAEIYLALALPKGSHAGAHRGVGKSFRKVLDDLGRGGSPRLAGAHDSAGIGAAMRIAPAAVYFADEPERLFDAVMAASLMTHRDIRSLAGAMAVAFATHRLVNGAGRDPSLLLRVAADVAKAEARIASECAEVATSIVPYGRSVSSAIANAERLVDLPRDRALAGLVDEANKHGADPGCRRPTLGFPPALIPTCLYLFVTTESFEEAIMEVVNLGGDADTAGAILGAMAGAHYGDDEIPDRLLDGLQNREGVAARGDALAHRDPRPMNIAEFVATERTLCRLEEECRDELISLRHGGEFDSGRV